MESCKTSKGGEQREVIVHTSIPKMVLSVTLWFLALWFWVALKHLAFDDPAILPINKPRIIGRAVFLPVILVTWAALIVRLARMAVINQWAALWIEDGRLVCPRLWGAVDIPVRDISRVEIVTDYFRPGIFLKPSVRDIAVVSKEGKRIKLSLGGVRESYDEIVSRIEQKIGMARRHQESL